jgi:hypothetical protein
MFDEGSIVDFLCKVCGEIVKEERKDTSTKFD